MKKNKKVFGGVIAKISNDLNVDAFYLRFAFLLTCIPCPLLPLFYCIFAVFLHVDDEE